MIKIGIKKDRNGVNGLLVLPFNFELRMFIIPIGHPSIWLVNRPIYSILDVRRRKTIQSFRIRECNVLSFRSTFWTPEFELIYANITWWSLLSEVRNCFVY